LAALFSVAHVGIFRALGYPLSARMFALVHRFADMRSSIDQRLNAGFVTALVITPLLFLLLARLRPRVLDRPRPRAAVVALAVVWVVAGLALRAQTVPDSWRRRAGKNPHKEMLASIASLALFDQRARIGQSYPPEFLDDFKPAAARALPPVADFAPRNVIVVVLESVAAQYLSLYGASYDTTPRLVAESRNAVVFDRFYANAGYTFQSLVPIAYSVYPGLPWQYRTDTVAPLPPGLAGVLRGRGHRTAFLAAANPEWGGMDWKARDAGFEEVLGPVELGGPQASSWGTEDGALIDGLVRWIDKDPARPFFALAWTDQTHDPYTLSKETPPVDFLDEKRVPHGQMFERYLNAIRQADHHLGRLFAHLRAKGIADDTLVVVTGDHGEGFGHEHGILSHGLALYDECQRVPMVIWNPKLFSSPRRVAAAGAHVDLNPTIAHLLAVPPHPSWQGASLFSPDNPGRAYMALEVAGFKFAVVDDRYKYILHVADGYEQLFDLIDDPREQEDRSGRDPARSAAMRARISAFIDSEERALKSR
jgi:hypothetical protein